MKTALIYGVTGQDGSYLSKFLLDKGYKVIGAYRRVSVDTTERLWNIQDNPNFKLVHSNIADAHSVLTTVLEHRPDEIYNLAAMSQVRMSFDAPEESALVTGVGHTLVLNAVKTCNQLFGTNIRVYFAASSEMFGSHVDGDGFQRETSKMEPCSPYGAAKLYAHSMNKIYRDGYGIHASSGILFNHESPERGETFVTRKITKYLGAVCRAVLFGDKTCEYTYIDNIPTISFGNLNACRDFGHSKDYIRGMWIMLQQDKPDDYVICTGETHSIIGFFEDCFNSMIKQFPNIAWFFQSGPDMRPDFKEFIKTYVKTDTNLYRAAEVDYLRGDCSKATNVLGWKPEISYQQLVDEMVYNDCVN